MNTKAFFSILFFSIICLSCKAQMNVDLIKSDIELSRIYQKFSENRHNYVGRDTILERFKKKMFSTLENSKSRTFKFDSLSQNLKIITSTDNNLRVFSWDELNGGSWHIYNSIYSYDDNLKKRVDFFKLKEDNTSNVLLTDASYYEIHHVEDRKYLIEGYGTHGGGEDFFVFRLVDFDVERIDCKKCFEGENIFVFQKSRGLDLKPEYLIKEKSISFPVLVPVFDEFGDETGRTKHTGQFKKLIYKNGVFKTIP